MKVLCAWCGNILEYDDNNNQESHGICMVCAIKELEKVGIDPDTYFVSSLRDKQPDRIIKPAQPRNDT